MRRGTISVRTTVMIRFLWDSTNQIQGKDLLANQIQSRDLLTNQIQARDSLTNQGRDLPAKSQNV